MKFKAYREKEEEEKITYVKIGTSIYGPAMKLVDEEDTVIGTVASINSKGRLVLHRALNAELGIDVTPNGYIIIEDMQDDDL